MVFRQVVPANNRVFDDNGVVEVHSAYVVPRGTVDDNGVVEVEDSEEEDDLGDRWRHETIRFTDSKYVDAKGRKWKTCGSSTWVPDEELGELTSVGSDTEDDEDIGSDGIDDDMDVGQRIRNDNEALSRLRWNKVEDGYIPC